jgi:hypothetical protein
MIRSRTTYCAENWESSLTSIMGESIFSVAPSYHPKTEYGEGIGELDRLSTEVKRDKKSWLLSVAV